MGSFWFLYQICVLVSIESFFLCLKTCNFQRAAEDEEDYNPGNCNILLYFGLGLLCVGSVITFVGKITEDYSLM